ncbi:MAG: hypothetical protein LBU68_00245 [Rickettsiales bacterium]|nr:hypothetical protein [Rickettsiales bacterium]
MEILLSVGNVFLNFIKVCGIYFVLLAVWCFLPACQLKIKAVAKPCFPSEEDFYNNADSEIESQSLWKLTLMYAKDLFSYFSVKLSIVISFGMFMFILDMI